mmetsp:Transcript_124053/g.386343  ORF Transcript_124053/g.386343 Transcript_124053/m.386343 type:complete len:81 (-) Transcript_124053:65-307(-)
MGLLQSTAAHCRCARGGTWHPDLVYPNTCGIRKNDAEGKVPLCRCLPAREASAASAAEEQQAHPVVTFCSTRAEQRSKGN